MGKGNIIRLTPSQVECIHKNYLTVPMKTLARQIGVSPGVIKRRLKQWGLDIPDEIKEKRRMASCFKKGDTPYNKGLKGDEYLSNEAKLKMSKTWFKKGHKPHNTRSKNDRFSVRKDVKGIPYMYYKISDSNWVLYHRYVWEQIHGKIPPDKIVVFKDQDHSNVTIDNLELISRSENLRRNHDDYYNEPESIKKVMDLMYKVTDKLNEYESK